MGRRKVRIMISSRCDDRFPATGEEQTTLTAIRRQLKKDIESAAIFGKEIFEVWINEDEPSEPGSQDSWDLCIEQAREADLLLVLYNGNAGWSLNKGDIGICHAEMMTAFSESPGKVSVLSLLAKDKQLRPSTPQDVRFQAYVDQANLFRGSAAGKVDAVLQEARKAVRESLLNIAHQGAREVKRSRYNTGAALDWTRMDFVTRQTAMRNVLSEALSARGTSASEGDGLIVQLSGRKVLFLPSAIPAAMTVAAAREMVGQPFLKDYRAAPQLKGSVAGPVHVIACHRSVTESQAMQLLGFPDATIVPGSFGIYVADNIQKIQLCLIANCRDESSTRHGLQKLFDWLGQTGEDAHLLERAISRSKIVSAIAKEAVRA
ncbi:MAG: hypothetical protein ABL907_15900 [Hyphomicrobium sp.]